MNNDTSDPERVRFKMMRSGIKGCGERLCHEGSHARMGLLAVLNGDLKLWTTLHMMFGGVDLVLSVFADHRLQALPRRLLQ